MSQEVVRVKLTKGGNPHVEISYRGLSAFFREVEALLKLIPEGVLKLLKGFAPTDIGFVVMKESDYEAMKEKCAEADASSQHFPKPEPLTAHALLFKVLRAANGLPATLKFTTSMGGLNGEFARTTECHGMSARFMQLMEDMGRGSDVVMLSKRDFLAILEELQSKASGGVRIVGCNGYPITGVHSPFGRENIGKLVTLG